MNHFFCRKIIFCRSVCSNANKKAHWWNLWCKSWWKRIFWRGNDGCHIEILVICDEPCWKRGQEFQWRMRTSREKKMVVWRGRTTRPRVTRVSLNEKILPSFQISMKFVLGMSELVNQITLLCYWRHTVLIGKWTLGLDTRCCFSVKITYQLDGPEWGY